MKYTAPVMEMNALEVEDIIMSGNSGFDASNPDLGEEPREE